MERRAWARLTTRALRQTLLVSYPAGTSEVLDALAGAIRHSGVLLGDDLLEPDPSRSDWGELRARVQLARQAMDEVLRLFPAALAEAGEAEALEKGRADVARGYLEAVLRRFDGQIAEAAAHVGVERESFYRLLRKYGVDAAAFRGSGGKG